MELENSLIDQLAKEIENDSDSGDISEEKRYILLF
jgi:hypothetical protein